MLSPLLRAVWFCMATTSWVLASQRPFESKNGIEKPKFKLDQSEAPAPFSLWSTLNRVRAAEGNFGPGNDQRAMDGVRRKDTGKKPACCSCGSDSSVTQKEDEVRAARLSMVADLLRDKLQLKPDGNDQPESDSFTSERYAEEEAALSKLPQGLVDETLQDNSEPEAEDYYAWDKQMMEPGLKFMENCPNLHSGGCYSFNLSDLRIYRDNIKTSQLWLHTTLDQRFQRQPHEIMVYEMLQHNMSDPESSLTRNRTIVHSYSVIKDSWFQVDLTEFIQQNLQDGSPSLSLAVACETCFKDNRREILGAEDGFKPLLVTNLQHKPARRERRSVVDDSCNPEIECCKRHLVVNVMRIRLQSVYRPQTLQIGYCHGVCDRITAFSSNHTLFKHWMRQDPLTQDRLRVNLRPCCVPTTLAAIDILRYVNGYPRTSTVPNAKVISCGCR